MRKTMTKVCVALACLGIVIPQAALAQTIELPIPAPPAQMADIALAPGGVLNGQVLDRQGIARAGARVILYRTGGEVARTTTDAQGRFAINGLPGGIYRIATPAGSGVFRLWAPGTAPPTAPGAALVIDGGLTQRGEAGGGLLGTLSNPLVMAGLAGAAIAIPLATSGDEDFHE